MQNMLYQLQKPNKKWSQQNRQQMYINIYINGSKAFVITIIIYYQQQES